MELTKLRENLASQAPLMVAENYAKPYNMKDEFPFEASSSSKGNYNYLQEFHHLDHQYHVNGSSSNPVFGVQNPCFDPYNDTTYTYEGSNAEVNFYECKPLNADQMNGGHGQVLDNFQGGNFQSGNFQGGNFQSGSGYLNFPTHRSNHLDHMLGTSSHRSASTNFLPLDCHDIKPINFVVPDEVSCINNAADHNGYYKKYGMNGKNRVSTVTRASSSTYKGQKKSNVVKGQWTIEEDRLLIQLVEQYGVRKWSHIAQMLPGRIGKQCRERWHNHLRPDIKKDTWSEEEDKILIQSHAEIGNKWAEIAKRLPGRTENSIKNHWNATKRRQYSKRKCRTKYPRGSLLQEYIKSLNLDSNSTGRQRKSNNTTNNNNATAPNNMTSSTKAATQTNVGFSCANDRLVPNYDFNEDPDFCFDDNIFQEGCSIDSLLGEIPCAHVVGENNSNLDGNMPCDAVNAEAPAVSDGDEKDFEMEMQADVVTPVMESTEVKKEWDLVEMMSQVN